jgi:hypothetical protein
LKDALLAEVRRSHAVLYNALIAQAQRMQVGADRITLTFSASQRIAPAFAKYRAPLEELASRLAGCRMSVVAETAAPDEAEDVTRAPAAPPPEGTAAADRKAVLRQQALADRGVQALLEVFPAEIRDVEEM